MDALHHIVYFLPCKPGAAYLNITADCLNDCLFCIRRRGRFFFGQDLSLPDSTPSTQEILAAIHLANREHQLNEVVFCGMGEPLLHYDHLLEVCKQLRDSSASSALSIRVDTSGLAWSRNKRLDLLGWIDDLNVSLNAESATTYERLCQPRIPQAYDVLFDFLRALKSCETEHKSQARHFPRIRLTVVDTSEQQWIPPSGKARCARGTFPVPDLSKCQAIADGFDWPLIVKRLFRDSCDDVWTDPNVRQMCARGVQLDRCKDCTYRH